MPDRLKKTLDELPEAQVSDQSFYLIGKRHLQSNNSWFHQYDRFMKQSDRWWAEINIKDAERLKVKDGDRIKVSSAVSAVVIPVKISDQIMEGVVAIPHGWGHGQTGTQLATANKTPGVSANQLTDDQIVDSFSGNAVFNGIRVNIEAVEEARQGL